MRLLMHEFDGKLALEPANSGLRMVKHGEFFAAQLEPDAPMHIRP
jgi:hypothetical protein